MTTPVTPTIPSQTTQRPLGHAVAIVISLYAAAVFIVLWAGLGVALVTGGGFLIDVYTWLTSLEPIAALLAWIAILPIGVGGWAVASDLGPLVMGLVLVGLVAWTLVAASGLVRAFRNR